MIKIAKSAISALRETARQSADGLETGGILLGIEDSSDGSTAVTIAGGPGPNAKRGPRSFHRDRAHAESLADAAYERDGSVWVGEWHTHPKGVSKPSARDLTTYTRLLKDSELEFHHFTSMIITSPDDWRTVTCHGWIVKILEEANMPGGALVVSLDLVEISELEAYPAREYE